MGIWSAKTTADVEVEWDVRAFDWDVFVANIGDV